MKAKSILHDLYFSTQSVELEIYSMVSELANGNYDLLTCAACVK